MVYCHKQLKNSFETSRCSEKAEEIYETWRFFKSDAVFACLMVKKM
jgi:hypothetical protein